MQNEADGAGLAVNILLSELHQRVKSFCLSQLLEGASWGGGPSVYWTIRFDLNCIRFGTYRDIASL